MPRARRAGVACTLVLLVATAGCVGGLLGSRTPGAPGTSDRPAATPAGTPIPSEPATTPPGFRPAEPTPEPLAGRANCSEDLWVAFWGLNDPRLWEAGQVRFGTYVPPKGSYLFVAYVDGTARGAEAVSTSVETGGLTVDGGAIDLPTELSGEHAVRIVVHLDADGDGKFDAGTDHPCHTDAGLVQSEHLLIDLDRYWR